MCWRWVFTCSTPNIECVHDLRELFVLFGGSQPIVGYEERDIVYDGKGGGGMALAWTCFGINRREKGKSFSIKLHENPSVLCCVCCVCVCRNKSGAHAADYTPFHRLTFVRIYLLYIFLFSFSFCYLWHHATHTFFIRIVPSTVAPVAAIAMVYSVAVALIHIHTHTQMPNCLFVVAVCIWVIWELSHLDRKAKVEDALVVVNDVDATRAHAEWFVVVSLPRLHKHTHIVCEWASALLVLVSQTMFCHLLEFLYSVVIVTASASIVLLEVTFMLYGIFFVHIYSMAEAKVPFEGDVWMGATQIIIIIISNVQFCKWMEIQIDCGCIHVKLLPLCVWVCACVEDETK